MVLGCVGWVIWPERAPNVRLRLKVVRNEIVDGNQRILFRVEGAELYEVYTTDSWYVRGGQLLPDFEILSFHNSVPGSEFFVDAPQGYLNGPEQGWKL